MKKFTVQAACCCNKGKVRKNNEDNFYFDQRCLPEINDGLKHPVCFESDTKTRVSFAVFDGIGGENFGESASYAAADQMKQTDKINSDIFITERQYWINMVDRLNNSVVSVKKEKLIQNMGTTMVGLFFLNRYVYVCNVGDSRAYRLRNGEFLQISEDHIGKIPENVSGKAPLTQYLGYDNEEISLEPYIAKGEIKKDDIYLICSDGLTDMLTNIEISDILLKGEDVEICTESLIQSALEHGGRDNITAIVCKII